MVELPIGNTYRIGEKEFSFSVAQSPLQLMTGLKGVNLAGLAPYDGMLFDFGTTELMIMTPRGCVMALELAFIDEDGVITEITKLDPWLGFNRAASSKVRYALEVPIGFFETHNIQVGDILV